VKPAARLLRAAEASSAELLGFASIAGSSSRDSLGTAPPTPAGVCVGASAQFSSPPAASSPAATCGALGSASAGQGSTAAPHAAEIVRVVFPHLGERFHGAAARLLEGPWRAAHTALADCAITKLQPGSLPNVGSSDIAHHYCSTASAEVKDLMYALVSLAVDFQTNAPQTPSTTDLLMCMRVKRAPKDSDDACVAVYNVVHRVLMRLRLQCWPAFLLVLLSFLFELKIHREALWTSARPASHERPLLAPLAPQLRLTPGLDLGVLDTT